MQYALEFTCRPLRACRSGKAIGRKPTAFSEQHRTSRSPSLQQGRAGRPQQQRRHLAVPSRLYSDSRHPRCAPSAPKTCRPRNAGNPLCRGRHTIYQPAGARRSAVGTARCSSAAAAPLHDSESEASSPWCHSRRTMRARSGDDPHILPSRSRTYDLKHREARKNGPPLVGPEFLSGKS